jgi:biotin carboxylase
VAAALGLPWHPPGAAAASRNKLISRKLFTHAGLPGPAFRVLRLDDDPAALADALPYPVVVKPVALSGSRGVMRVDDPSAFLGAFERLRRLLRSADVLLDRDPAHEIALIESFVPGRELAVEGVLTAGTFHTLALFDKPDPLDGPFFEETIYVTPSREPQSVQADIVGAVATAARALGLHHGPVHAECRVGPGGVFVLEVAARPIGGLCARALRFSAGSGLASLEEVLLRHAIGEDISGMTREPCAAGVMMIPIPRRGIYRDVTGLEAAGAVPGIEDVHITAKPDALLLPLPEGRSYLGFIFARGDDSAGVERALRTAHRHLHFAIERDVSLVS